MLNTKKVLIAVDGSPHSLNGVKYVAQQWAPAGLKVNLMYVMPTAPEIFWDLEQDDFFKHKMKTKYAAWKRTTRKMAQGFLDDARNLLVKAKVTENDVGVILQERKTGIARDILEECARGYDAVVVGRRGLNKLEDLFLGSVSNKIVERVHDIPVWVVGGEIQSKKMLLAVDASDNSRKAVEYVGTFASGTEAELTLYHVVRRFGIGAAAEFAEGMEDLGEEVESTIQRMFQAYQKSLELAGVPAARVSTRYKTDSYTRAGDILREAREGRYGTIVMGRRGLSRVREFLMGRVTSKVLSRAEGLALWIVP
ncbi:MAG: universal stress protein [Syntrophobacteria bacterium]